MKPLTLAVIAVIAVVMGIGIWFRVVGIPEVFDRSGTVVVAHWATGHLTRDGLLKDMANDFNNEGYRIGSGKKIVVEVYDAPSELQGEYLSELLRFGTRRDLHAETHGYVAKNIPDPTIVTPSSAHWLVTLNHEVGREVVDLDTAESIVQPVIGIVTYEEMAKCLGWPEKKIGFADIIALRDNPDGWASYPCAKAEWGRRPLLAFTDPTTSSTGRSLHLGLYAIAAGKAPEELTLKDVADPDVVAYIKGFQNLIDHYQIGTTVLNTKIHQGPRYGHFFIMPEDNLIHLYQGIEEAYFFGKRLTAPPIEPNSMVMIYPKEGALPRNNCACIVQANSVSPEQVEGSEMWIDFILQDAQQRTFLAAGLRPGSDLTIDHPSSPIGPRYGLSPEIPKVLINPALIDPVVASAIDGSWQDVKKPGIVTLVVDISASMKGAKLEQAGNGVERFLDSTPSNNQVGLVTFNESVIASIPGAPIDNNRHSIADTVRQSQAQGESALYDAIKAGIEMTDSSAGAEGDIRGVVVLTDGKTTMGETRLHDLIVMRSGSECPVEEEGYEGIGYRLVDQCTGDEVQPQDVTGIRLALETQHPIQIFFIGISDDVDLNVGRMLAEATAAEYEGVAEDDLAKVIEAFGKYF